MAVLAHDDIEVDGTSDAAAALRAVLVNPPGLRRP